MKFSFIIPAKNEEEYIEDCIKSVKNQKGNYEIIVVDSGSDRTGQIARKMGAKVLREERKGPGIARNTGAKKAKGDVFVFMDADVRIGKDFLGKIEKHFARSIAGGICHMSAYDPKGGMEKIAYRIPNLIARLLLGMGFSITHGSLFVYKRDIFEKAGMFNPEMMTNEDHDMAKRASRFGRFVFFGDVRIQTSARRVNRMGAIGAIKTYMKSTVFFLKGKYLHDYWD